MHHAPAQGRGRIRIQVHTLDERAEREVDGPPGSGGGGAGGAGAPGSGSTDGMLGLVAGGRGVMIPNSTVTMAAGHRAPLSLSLPDLAHSPQSALSGSGSAGVGERERGEEGEDDALGSGVEIGGLGSVVGTGRVLRRWRDWIKVGGVRAGQGRQVGRSWNGSRVPPLLVRLYPPPLRHCPPALAPALVSPRHAPAPPHLAAYDAVVRAHGRRGARPGRARAGLTRAR